MPDGLLQSARAAVDIALKAGASDAIANVEDSSSTVFDFRDGKLEKVQQSASRSLSIALYVDGRFSSHSTTDLRPNELRRFIGDAIELTKHLEPDPFRVIPDPSFYENRPSVDLDLVDPGVEAI